MRKHDRFRDRKVRLAMLCQSVRAEIDCTEGLSLCLLREMARSPLSQVDPRAARAARALDAARDALDVARHEVSEMMWEAKR